MSSFLAHSVVGGALWKGKRLSVGWLGYLVFFACLPDIEYLILWIFNFEFEIRWTHSFVFLLICWSLSFGITKTFAGGKFKTIWYLSGVALVTHLGMDYLVGVYHNPLFIPFSYEGFSSPIGVLPSAGKPNLGNFYFWRNLAIETGIIGPILFFSILRGRWSALKYRWITLFIMILIFAITLTISLSLRR